MVITVQTVHSILPLENGDALPEPISERLTRDEFERFYAASLYLNNAELTEYTENVHQASSGE
jgi:hypothetical protein